MTNFDEKQDKIRNLDIKIYWNKSDLRLFFNCGEQKLKLILQQPGFPRQNEILKAWNKELVKNYALQRTTKKNTKLKPYEAEKIYL